MQETAGEDERVIRSQLAGLAKKTPLEDFNFNSLLLDVDGNSWSDRCELAGPKLIVNDFET